MGGLALLRLAKQGVRKSETVDIEDAVSLNKRARIYIFTETRQQRDKGPVHSW